MKVIATLCLVAIAIELALVHRDLKHAPSFHVEFDRCSMSIIDSTNPPPQLIRFTTIKP